MSNSAPKELPFKVSVLVFLKNEEGKFLLMKRNKTPNKGLYSPVGGKLEMAIGESPFECACREVQEETEHSISTKDLHLFCMISEKAFEDKNHWLMFLFECHKPLTELPKDIDEGSFAFFSRQEIETLDIAETDRQALWDVYDKHHTNFVALRADCHSATKLDIITEQITRS